MEHQTINSPDETALALGVLTPQDFDHSLKTIYSPRVKFFGSCRPLGQIPFYPVKDIWKVTQENNLINKLNEPLPEKFEKETTQTTPTGSAVEEKSDKKPSNLEVKDQIANAIIGKEAPPLPLPDVISDDPPPILPTVKENFKKNQHKVYSLKK